MVTGWVAEPLLPPKQVTLVDDTDEVIPQGNAAIVSVYCNKAEQLLASRKSAIQVPAGSETVLPGNPAQLTPLYGGVPPLMVILAVPLPLHGASVCDVVAVNAVGCVTLYCAVLVHTPSVTVTA